MNALADALFSRAEELRFGSSNSPEKNPTEALKLYSQASRLGHSKAYLRLGEMYEQAIGTKQDLNRALQSYSRAAKGGVIEGIAATASLLQRGSRGEQADRLWREFFSRLLDVRLLDPLLDDRAFWAHRYLLLCISQGIEPYPHAGLLSHLREIISRHQLSLEHSSDDQLDLLDKVGDWLAAHFQG